MDFLLQAPTVIQTVINSYMSSQQLQRLHAMYPSHNFVSTAERVKFKHFKTNQLRLYNPKTLKDVEINHLDDPMALTELYNFNLKRLRIDGLSDAIVMLNAHCMQELIEVFTHVALTLEELKIYDDIGPEIVLTNLLDNIVFPRLRSLHLVALLNIKAPELTSLDFNSSAVDITKLDYPNLTEFSTTISRLKNVTALTQFSLTSLELNRDQLDENISITGLNLVRLSLNDVRVPEELLFPQSLEHLVISTGTFDMARIQQLNLKTLRLSVRKLTAFGEIRLSRLESLHLSEFVLDDTFIVNAPVLTELTLFFCEVKYTSTIQAPCLNEVTVDSSECTDFLPTSVVKLSLEFTKGPIVRSVKALTKLKSLEAQKVQFKLKWVRHLHLSWLALRNCDVSSLEHLREMSTLRELCLAYNRSVTDITLKDLTHLNLSIVDLYNTGVTEAGLKYLPPTLQRLILPSMDQECFRDLNLNRLQELWVSVSSEQSHRADIINKFTGKQTHYPPYLPR